MCMRVVIQFVVHLCLCMWKGRGFEIESSKQIQEKKTRTTTVESSSAQHKRVVESVINVIEDRPNYRYKDKTKVGKR